VTLHLDSRQRDVAKYPSPSSYVVQLPETLRDVVSAELVYASYQKFCNDDYFVLSVAELEPNMISLSHNSHLAFTQLPLLNDNINTYNSRTHYRSVKRFQQPRASISRLTVRVMMNSGAAAPIKDHVMRFEFRCLVNAPSPYSEGRGESSFLGGGGKSRDASSYEAYADAVIAGDDTGISGSVQAVDSDEEAARRRKQVAAVVTLGAGAALTYYAYRNFGSG
jgi:hypothetical protein